jgi:hypothetical protein
VSLGAKKIEHPYLDLIALVLVIVMVAGAGVWYRSFSVAQAERQKQSASVKAQKARVGAFNGLMESRTAFLVLNSQVDGTLGQVKSKIDNNVADQKHWNDEWARSISSFEGQVAAVVAHNEAEDAKYKADPRYTSRDYWSYPNRPSPPPPITVEFSTEIASLTAQAAGLKGYLKELEKSSGKYSDASISPIYRDLVAAAEATLSATEKDIEILGGIAVPGDQGTVVNEAKSDLMKFGAGDPALKALNKKALAFIKEAGLDKADYEVPGGADSNPSDKSNLQ